MNQHRERNSRSGEKKSIEVPGSPIVVNRIVTTGVERMAAQESAGGEDQTSDHPESGNGLAGKFRTGGGKTAGRECPRRNHELVSSNGC